MTTIFARGGSQSNLNDPSRAVLERETCYNAQRELRRSTASHPFFFRGFESLLLLFSPRRVGLQAVCRFN